MRATAAARVGRDSEVLLHPQFAMHWFIQTSASVVVRTASRPAWSCMASWPQKRRRGRACRDVQENGSAPMLDRLYSNATVFFPSAEPFGGSVVPVGIRAGIDVVDG